MHKFEQEIQNHHNAIVKSISSSFPEVAVPRISVEKFADLQKGHEVFSVEKLNQFVATCQDNFIKGLESGGDVEDLKKGLDDAKTELSTLQKVIIFDADQKETTYFVRQIV